MSALVSIPPSGIKSVQRGLLTMASGDLNAAVTITAVNLSKAESRIVGYNTNGAASGASADQTTVRLWFQNATTLYCVRTAGGNVMQVAWEVVEWN